MKSLLYVLKTLLQINGAIAVLALLTVVAMGQKHSEIVATSPETAKGFHRNIQDIPSDNQQQIEANRQQIEALKAEKDQQIKALQAQLETHQTAKDSTKSVNHTPLPTIAASKIANRETRTVEAKSQTTHQNNYAQRTKSPSTPVTRPSVTAKRQVPSKLAKRANPAPEPSKESNQTLAMVSIPISEQQNKQSIDFVQEQQPLTLVEQSKQRQVKQVNSSKSVITPSATTPLKAAIPLANDLAAGLIVAQREKQINYRTRTYKKVQTAIGSLRKGSSSNLEEAANRAQIEASVLKQVAEWGRERPGRFEAPKVSLANSESTPD
ncbi:hypothetical protein [Crocosphaera sp. XPORK-15E]|uniref:hypothetical protein n=1 Tax=Crocosphaera sp. XPORK-15E TaxID=3110247 RepID=UPI002B2161ED|nr:hypothetical protein [Crocosphaera sp. XPORK-15E]MEA5535648.1 hypothetical protein [Crocosphaera sp. XPORK-15E]